MHRKDKEQEMEIPFALTTTLCIGYLYFTKNTSSS